MKKGQSGKCKNILEGLINKKKRSDDMIVKIVIDKGFSNPCQLEGNLYFKQFYFGCN